MSTISFRRCHSVTSKVVVISLGACDKIRVINGDQAVVDRIAGAIGSVWTVGQRVQKPNPHFFNAEIGLKYHEDLMIHAFKDGHFLTKAVVMHMLDAMDSMNYKLLVRADINSRKRQYEDSEYFRDVDSFFFIPMSDYGTAMTGVVQSSHPQPYPAPTATATAPPIAAPGMQLYPNSSAQSYPPPPSGGQPHLPSGVPPYPLSGVPLCPPSDAPPYPPSGTPPYPPFGAPPYPPPSGLPNALPSDQPHPSTGLPLYPPPGVPPLGSQPYPPLGDQPYPSTAPDPVPPVVSGP